MQRKGGDLGVSGDELPPLGGTRASPARHGGAGPAVPGSEAPGAPDRDEGSSGHGKELRGGLYRPGAALTTEQDLPRCKVSAQRGGAGEGAGRGAEVEPRPPQIPPERIPGRCVPPELPGTSPS